MTSNSLGTTTGKSGMLHIEKATIQDAERITEIKTAAFNQEINTYLGRNGGSPGYNEVSSELHIIEKFGYQEISRDEDEIEYRKIIQLQ